MSDHVLPEAALVLVHFAAFRTLRLANEMHACLVENQILLAAKPFITLVARDFVFQRFDMRVAMVLVVGS